MAEPAPLGVGIDLEAPEALGHLDQAALCRAAERWLTAAERAWCAEQSSLGESLVVVLSCKEAVFKARPGPGPVHEVRLALEGTLEAGRARTEDGSVTVRVRWRRWRGQVAAVAVAR